MSRPILRTHQVRLIEQIGQTLDEGCLRIVAQAPTATPTVTTLRRVKFRLIAYARVRGAAA